jgi:hypothetical protein
MTGETSDQAVFKATGRSKNDWYAIIEEGVKDKMTHPEIAEFLRKEYDLSPWWSQEITVLFEKHAGTRVTGQTMDAGFQVGINKTIPVPHKKLWALIFVENRLGLFQDNKLNLAEGLTGVNSRGVSYKITTYRPYSHIRMQWRLPNWDEYSILQIRLNAKTDNNTTLSIHQEKLKNKNTREAMKLFWKKELEKEIL